MERNQNLVYIVNSINSAILADLFKEEMNEKSEEEAYMLCSERERLSASLRQLEGLSCVQQSHLDGASDGFFGSQPCDLT